MELRAFCNEIKLQPQIKSCVFTFSDRFDFTTVEKQLKVFQDYKKMSEALTELQAILGEDTDHIKILSCMLKASVDVYDLPAILKKIFGTGWILNLGFLFLQHFTAISNLTMNRLRVMEKWIILRL